MRGAHLNNADMSFVDLCGADLRFADLQKTKLIFADLRTDLRLADLTDADLRDAKHHPMIAGSAEDAPCAMNPRPSLNSSPTTATGGQVRERAAEQPPDVVTLSPAPTPAAPAPTEREPFYVVAWREFLTAYRAAWRLFLSLVHEDTRLTILFEASLDGAD